MTLDAVLNHARAQAESRMRDTCTVTAPGTSGELNAATGLPSHTAGAVIYAGKYRLRTPGTGSPSDRQVSGDRVALSTPTAFFPVSAPPIPVGAIITCTAVPADDAGGHLRLGRRVRVTGLILGTDMTAQRVQVEAVTG
jgi:Family of unknown function (DUF6093)